MFTLRGDTPDRQDPVPPGGVGGEWVPPETLYHRDDALLYIAYVMLIWAAPIPADRGTAICGHR